MRCHCLRIQTIVPRGVAGQVRTRKTGESRTRSSGGANDPMRDDVDGEEAMVPRCKTDRRPRVDGTRSVQKAGVAIALRRRVERMRIPHERKESCVKLTLIMASLVVTEKMCCRSCVSSVGTVSTGCVEATVVDRKGASDYASSFLTAFIKESGIQENSGEIRQ